MTHSTRTVLNGGEREQEQDKEKIEDPAQDSRTNLNGGDLVRSTFPIITFSFTLAFMATLVLALVLAFVATFGGRIFTSRSRNLGTTLLHKYGLVVLRQHVMKLQQRHFGVKDSKRRPLSR